MTVVLQKCWSSPSNQEPFFNATIVFLPTPPVHILGIRELPLYIHLSNPQALIYGSFSTPPPLLTSVAESLFDTLIPLRHQFGSSTALQNQPHTQSKAPSTIVATIKSQLCRLLPWCPPDILLCHGPWLAFAPTSISSFLTLQIA